MGRNHSLDLARAILLVLGIPLHIFGMYSIGQEWIVNSGQPSFLATSLSAAIHSFRMHAFFMLAGYFSMMVIEKRGGRAWMKDRVLRVLFPGLVAMLTVVQLCTFIVNYDNFGRFDYSFSINEQSGAIETYHIWFLFTLFEISCIFYLVYRFFDSINDIYVRVFADNRGYVWKSCVILVLLLGLALAGFVPAALVRILGKNTVGDHAFRVAMYMPFFMLGAVAHKVPQVYANIFTPRKIFVGVGVIALAICMMISVYGEVRCGEDNSCGFMYSAISRVSFVVGGLLISIGFFGILNLINSKKSLVVSYFVSGALVMYIFHMPVVLLFGHIFKLSNMPADIEIIVVLVLSLLIVMIVFEAVRRVRLLEVLFNGGKIKPPVENSFFQILYLRFIPKSRMPR